MGGERRFFYPPVPRTKAGGKPVGAIRLYATLIRANYGRTPDEIGRRFTRRQVNAFFAEEQARERRLRRCRISDVNAAMAGGNPANKLLQDLED